MKIAQICPRYYPYIGGVEYVVKSSSERLIKLGYEVTVFAGESNINKHAEEVINGVRVIRWPVWSPGNAYYIPKLRSKLKEFLIDALRDVDIIHIHNVHTIFSYFVWKILKEKEFKKEVRVIITPYYHGIGHTFFRSTLWIGWRYLVGRMLRESDAIHTVSSLEAHLIEKHFGLNAIPIENGVEDYVLTLDYKPNDYFLYAGRIEKYKNIYKVAEVISILNKELDHSFKLVIIGSGSYKDKLIAKLDNLRIKYELLPFQPFENYIRYLSRAALFSLLSEKESYPQSVNEANAIGVPTVITEPWGVNFLGRNRILIVTPLEEVKNIAYKVHKFLYEAQIKPKPEVPSWDSVVKTYILKLYCV